jgi:hypothetical protein
MRSIVLAACTGLVFAPGAGATPPAQTDAAASAEQRRDALLAAMGGAAVWREVIGARITATHYTTQTRLPYRNVIWNDFRRFRLRIEANNRELTRVFDYDGDTGWRDDGVSVTPIPAARVADERAWWSANIYRTLHRLALPDPALSVRLLEPDRLAVFEQGRGLLVWFRLNSAGEPLQFGTDPVTPGTTFGPLAAHAGGARYPRWGTDASGSWRYEVHDAEFSNRAFTMPPVPSAHR